MSKFINSFALLDDSDDESPRAAAPPAAKKKESAKTSSSNSNAVKAAKGNDRRRNNDRNTRGGRGPRTARDGKRTYDRRSGTGRGREIKKGGGGGHNWGNDKNEARKNEGPVDENAPVEVATDAVEVEEEVEKVPDPEPEPEDNTMTMEEYLAAKSGKAAGDDLFGAKKERSADEAIGEFAGKEAHVAVQEDFVVMGSGKSLRKKNEKKAVQTLDLNFRVKSASDPRPRRDDRNNGDRRGGRGGRGDRRGGRGGRGGGRGGRGKGGGRGLKVDDVNAFPSL